MCSHTVIQLGEVSFYDMAEIDMLKSPGVARQISKDFSGMTNTILALSQYYKDHNGI